MVTCSGAELIELMHSLGEEAVQTFETRWDGDRLIGFSDVKTLFVGTNRN